MYIRLFVWPGSWGLPSIDAECLAAIAQLQIAYPDGFSICECTNANESPDGRLPFIKVGPQSVPGCDIPHYLASSSPEQQLTTYKNDILAYTSLAFDSLTDLLHHSLFSLPQNYLQTTRPALASSLSIPRKWIYPAQLRSSLQPRLEMKNLWGLGGDADREETQERAAKFNNGTEQEFTERSREKKKKFVDDAKKSFDTQKIIKFARNAFDPFSTKLGDKSYFYGESPSLLDAVVASHLILFLSAPLPQPIVPDLLKSDYPKLVQLAQRIHESLLNNNKLTIIPLSSSPSTSLLTSSLLSIPNTISSSLFSIKTFLFSKSHLSSSSSSSSSSSAAQQKQKQFARKRLLWLMGVSVAMASYIVLLPIVINISKNRNRTIYDGTMLNNGAEEEEYDEDDDEIEEVEIEEDDD